ncbi:Parallel beta-helix repeat [uncultured Caudovirales phage]|uniref:Parallel beta-helix repeat n=1 Tax=uncultured Caudovirales phage TaxID=2100421 RepID=A0A6J5KL09_9CAUD|nr:Parallel beta-helix repeat [uncultured Caudovirales phage]
MADINITNNTIEISIVEQTINLEAKGGQGIQGINGINGGINLGIAGSNGSFTATSGSVNFYAGNNITLSTGTNQQVSIIGANQPTQTAYTFSNSNGVSFGTNGSVVTASVATNYQSQGAYLTTAQPVGNYLTTAMQSNASTAFAGTNAAMTGGSITHNTNGISINLPYYLTTAQPIGAYLTTAMLSNAGSNFVGLGTAITGGSMTGNTSGISINIPVYQSQGAYLTTAMLSNASTAFAGTGAAITGGSITHNTAGISINLPAYLTTAQPVGAYLTTAMASNAGSNFVGLNTAITGGSMTANSSGITISIPAGVGGTNYIGLNTAITGGSMTGNTSGISINIPIYQTTGNYLTTAMVSNAGSNFIGLNTAITNGSLTANSSGISINLPVYQSQGAYLTTAMASNAGSNFVGLNTAVTGASLTANSNGISLNVPVYQTTGNYLTTAMQSNASSAFAGTNSAITGGSITHDTSGISINLPAYLTTAQPVGAYLTTAMASNAGSNFIGLGTAITGASMTANSNGISLNVPAAAPSPVYIQAGSTNGSLGTISFADGNGVTFGLNGSTLTASVGGGAATMASYYENIPAIQNSTLQLGTGVSNYIQPFELPYNISASYLRMPVQMTWASTTANTSNSSLSYALSQSQTMWVNIYTMGTGASSASLGLYAVASNTMAMVMSATYGASNAQTVFNSISYPLAGGSSTGSASLGSQTAVIWMGTGGLTNFTGSRMMDLAFNSSLSAGAYWMAVQRSTQSSASTQVSSGVSNATFQINNIINTQANSAFNAMGVSNAVSANLYLGLGAYSASATGATTNQIALSLVSSAASQPRFPFQLIRLA